MAFNFPLFPVYLYLLVFDYFLAYLLVFWLFFGFLFEQALQQWLFQYLFKPKRADTFFYSFKFYEETFRLCCVITTKRLLPQSGRTPPRVETSPQNGRTQPGSQTYTNPQSGRIPPRVEIPVHKMDGSNQGHKLKQVHKVDGLHQGSRPQSTKWTDPTRSKTYTSPQSGRTPPRVKTPVHKMDGPHQGSRP